MQDISAIQSRVLKDAEKILSELSSQVTAGQMTQNESQFDTLRELAVFLKVLAKYSSKVEKAAQIDSENQETNYNHNFLEEGTSLIEEEAAFSNELKEILPSERSQHESVPLEEEAEFNNVLNEIEAQENYEQVLETKELLNEEEIAEDEGRLTDFAKVQNLSGMNNDVPSPAVNKESLTAEADTTPAEQDKKLDELNELSEGMQQAQAEERKFRLANIKGLSKAENGSQTGTGNLTFNATSSADSALYQPNSKTPSQHDFKLDLNDRLAFTDTLFKGNQQHLNDTISKLNSFKTVDEAREYLSDIYYQNNWSKHDEYAQRLWSLVESKFL